MDEKTNTVMVNSGVLPPKGILPDTGYQVGSNLKFQWSTISAIKNKMNVLVNGKRPMLRPELHGDGKAIDVYADTILWDGITYISGSALCQSMELQSCKYVATKTYLLNTASEVMYHNDMLVYHSAVDTSSARMNQFIYANGETLFRYIYDESNSEKMMEDIDAYIQYIEGLGFEFLLYDREFIWTKYYRKEYENFNTNIRINRMFNIVSVDYSDWVDRDN